MLLFMFAVIQGLLTGLRLTQFAPHFALLGARTLEDLADTETFTDVKVSVLWGAGLLGFRVEKGERSDVSVCVRWFYGGGPLARLTAN
jgi:hypothetical protein